MRKITLSLIGIGTGNIEHLTLQAIKEISRADLLLLPKKTDDKAELLNLRKIICANYVKDHQDIVEFDMPMRDQGIETYLQRVDLWHESIANLWQDKIESYPQARHIALLIWGDPALYDSSLRIAERLASKFDIDLAVIPGITSIQTLTAAHLIPFNRLAGTVMVTTGRQLRDQKTLSCERVIVMLDGENSFQYLNNKHGIDIFWSAYLGMDMQTSLNGRLCNIEDDIIQMRDKLRRKHGWIMDIYLLATDPAKATT